jgi:hypothetical protein
MRTSRSVLSLWVRWPTTTNLDDQKICVSTRRAVHLIKAECRTPCPHLSLCNELTKSAIPLRPAKLLSEKH